MDKEDLKYIEQGLLATNEFATNEFEEALSSNENIPTKTGKAYKVFKVKNGKLYPPMVANQGGKDTPIGVWLDAEEGEFAGLSKTGRPQVKSTGSGNLAYRPGWHLGDIPRAKQFDRLNKETGEYEFPKDFVWAECDYAMDIDYQPEADEQGYMRTKKDEQGNVTTYRGDKYQHSLAGLKKLPTRRYYKYRTNPNPDTVPWVITGQMKVNRLLSDDEVNEILKQNGIAPIHRQGGDKTLKELGLNESLKEYKKPEKLYNIENGLASFTDAGEDYVYWGSEADDWEPQYANAYKVRMTPKEFLDLTTEKGADSLKLGDKLGVISLGNPLELRKLDIDEFNSSTDPLTLHLKFLSENRAKVTSHEGRHRAFALMLEGVLYVDVMLQCGDKLGSKYDKYAPFDFSQKYLTLIGQFNERVTVKVSSPQPLSWENHLKSKPDVRDRRKFKESLEEDLTTNEETQLEEIDNLINDLYALRQQSIQEEGEYGIGNLVFKEFRNLGYLDNLKKIKRQLLSKQLSLESLNEVVKVDKIKLSQTQDRRVKLTSEDKEQIRQLYSTGDYSLNDLAKQFNVSKKTILLIVNQESKAKSDERIKNHWKDYYDKDKHSKAVKDTREYKKGLLSKGEIQEQPKLKK